MTNSLDKSPKNSKTNKCMLRIPFMGFLFTTTLFTVVFIFAAQGFCIAETSKTREYAT